MKKLNVIVVDDEQIIHDSIKRHLRKENLNVISFLNVNEALDEIIKGTVDIILSDLMMPEIDGLELMKRVLLIDPDIPIIMVTGYATISSALQATQLGAFDYIAKPFTKAELLSVISRATDQVRTANGEEIKDEIENEAKNISPFRTIGQNAWIITEPEGIILVGVERRFLRTIGLIQTVYLPEVGEVLSQGEVLFKLFSTDLRSRSMLAPLSGEVVEVNEEVINHPNKALDDPYGNGWLVRIKPSNFEEERKQLR
jgi:FixJ family two-component response regulator/glycine cleavage system H lipoate-binding protein